HADRPRATRPAACTAVSAAPRRPLRACRGPRGRRGRTETVRLLRRRIRRTPPEAAGPRRRTRGCAQGCSTRTSRQGPPRGRCREAASCGRDSPGARRPRWWSACLSPTRCRPAVASQRTRERGEDVLRLDGVEAAAPYRADARLPAEPAQVDAIVVRVLLLGGDAGVVTPIADDRGRMRPRAEVDGGGAADRDRRRP